MALEQSGEYEFVMTPGPLDPHTHPRVLDARTLDDFDMLNGMTEGKAGLPAYTAVALRSGITAMIAMSNEMIRLYDVDAPEQTVLEAFPIANLDRVRTMQSHVQAEAFTPVGLHYGLDVNEIFLASDPEKLDESKLLHLFRTGGAECLGLKIVGGDTTGGNALGVTYIPRVAQLWTQVHPGKPVVTHLEDENVGVVLEGLSHLDGGKEVAVHVAHVSSRQELEAVIEAKRLGMNVTCEVTPHHLFLDESARAEIGGYGWVKPTLKGAADREFLWAHIDDIDMFGSDCAPHRRSDKESAQPAYGLANHTPMVPLLLGAVAEGKLTMEDVYQKLCVVPRRRFNLPADDGSRIRIVKNSLVTATSLEQSINPRYGQNPFVKLEQNGHEFRMGGEVVEAVAGQSYYSVNETNLQTSYTHLIRPKNIGRVAVASL